jgi:hypothetical protein
MRDTKGIVCEAQYSMKAEGSFMKSGFKNVMLLQP